MAPEVTHATTMLIAKLRQRTCIHIFHVEEIDTAPSSLKRMWCHKRYSIGKYLAGSRPLRRPWNYSKAAAGNFGSIDLQQFALQRYSRNLAT